MIKRGFTLAEVLITLGIIGVVAAMTLPSLIQNYKKQAVISKLKKASSIISQAYNMSIAQYGTRNNDREVFEAQNPDAALEMLNKYYTPYLKVGKTEKGNLGAFAYLTDGTALYFFRHMIDSNTIDKNAWGNTYMIFCLTHKACREIDETSYSSILKSLGAERFTLSVTGTMPTYTLNHSSRDDIKNLCKEGSDIEACTSLIGGDGWEIREDYPIKL